jgi:hypothetical protein
MQPTSLWKCKDNFPRQQYRSLGKKKHRWRFAYNSSPATPSPVKTGSVASLGKNLKIPLGGFMGPGQPSLKELKAKKEAEEKALAEANPDQMAVETTQNTAPSTTRKRSETGGRMTHLTLDRPEKKRRPLSKKPSEIMSLLGNVTC